MMDCYIRLKTSSNKDGVNMIEIQAICRLHENALACPWSPSVTADDSAQLVGDLCNFYETFSYVPRVLGPDLLKPRLRPQIIL